MTARAAGALLLSALAALSAPADARAQQAPAPPVLAPGGAEPGAAPPVDRPAEVSPAAEVAPPPAAQREAAPERSAPPPPRPAGPGPLAKPGVVPEPEGYHGEPYRAPVPATLRGAEVIGDPAAHALWRAGVPFLDLLPTAVKPANLPPGTLWRDPPHATIPGALWLANTGYDALDPDTERYFRAALERASGGRADAPLVFFCERDCWMSWNGAKRAIAQGYTRVFWYPGGTDGWAANDWPLEPVRPYAPEPAPGAP